MTRLLQGWTITNGLAVIWRDGRVDQVLLDEPDMGFADATDVAFTPDGRYALVTSSGTDRVAVVDVAKLLSLIRRLPPTSAEHVLPNHLGNPTEFVVKHIPTGKNPRGILITPDGTTRLRRQHARRLAERDRPREAGDDRHASTSAARRQSRSTAGASSSSTTRTSRSTGSSPATPAIPTATSTA